MFKKIFVLCAALGILLSPIIPVQAQNGGTTVNDENVRLFMNQMMNGDDAESRRWFSEMMNGDDYRKGYGHMMPYYTLDKASPFYLAAAIGRCLFGLMILSLLFLLNAILYKKLTMMNGKKK